MGLFKKKPGGTLIGNLLRMGANKASGGILGNGANMLPAMPSQAQGQYEAMQQNQQRLGDLQTNGSSSPLDLGKFVKLPTMDVGPDKNTSLLMWVGIGLAAIFLFKKK